MESFQTSIPSLNLVGFCIQVLAGNDYYPINFKGTRAILSQGFLTDPKTFLRPGATFAFFSGCEHCYLFLLP